MLLKSAGKEAGAAMGRGRRILSVRQLTVGGLFAALIGTGAFVKITLPTQPVPMHITLQWFFVLLAGLLLDKRLAGMSVGVYLVLGLAGVPVFASGGGPSYLLRPTFGYLLGFGAAACVMARLRQFFQVSRFGGFVRISAAGLFVYYGIGMLYYYLICRLLIRQDVTWRILLFNGFFLTAGADFGLCLAAASAAVKLRPAVRRVLDEQDRD